MYIFNAITTLIKLFADPNALKELYEWQVGTLAYTNMNDIPVMLIFVVSGYIILQFLSRKLNLLASGDESAKGLGIDAEKMRRLILLVVALVTASIVSFTGMIGFVGLVAPHIVRLFIGSDNRYLMPASAAFGALLLVVADLVGRLIIAPQILQVGVVTAFLGGPLFLWLILRKKSNVW
jgi:iron complex transport system permease protein